jgi:8-amino-7-oxononanoate synthase
MEDRAVDNGAPNDWMQERMEYQLEQRKLKGSLRRLTAAATVDKPFPPRNNAPSIDFRSNDYLGLAHDIEQYQFVERTMKDQTSQLLSSNCHHDGSKDYSLVPLLGATGSRLLSGDSPYVHRLEQRLAAIHNGAEALVCNTGYTANVSLVSTLPCDCILYDEYAHNSLHMGMRLWQTSSEFRSSGQSEQRQNRQLVPFLHNNVADLRAKLKQYSGSRGDDNNQNRIVILMESVYSMDGDVAPVRAMLDVAWEFDARVVVDEAHGLGGVIVHVVEATDATTGTSTTNSGKDAISVLAATQCEQHPALACAVYTFGKAAGCHGAVIVSPKKQGRFGLKDYWINFGYPVIYSTALSWHSLVAIDCAYTTMLSAKGRDLREQLRRRIEQFQTDLSHSLAALPRSSALEASGIHYRAAPSPIQALIVPGNEMCSVFCTRLYEISHRRILLYPIKSPTVPVGEERVRIIVHAHNSSRDVQFLVQCIVQTVQAIVPVAGTSAAQLSKL